MTVSMTGTTKIMGIFFMNCSGRFIGSEDLCSLCMRCSLRESPQLVSEMKCPCLKL
jgi:hypothetical protein